ncbi:MAG TPA: zeta toxin family protein [Mucilaginibacter sp.]|nr:zeta toxin family protein [Mucilaginibacter sp.]
MPAKVKRLRIVAGPNGSGKSTIIETLRKNFDCGVYLNTDDIEKILGDKGLLRLSDYLVESNSGDYEAFLKTKNIQSLIIKAERDGFPIHLRFDTNLLITDQPTHSYEAAVAAEFLKYRLLSQGELFTFETVMSHPSKLDFVKLARQSGYKVYLYFVSTESVEINVQRVAQRVIKKGHPVPEDHIRSRYTKSLELLSEMIPLSYRTYLFDNSSETDAFLKVAEIYRGKELTIHVDPVPEWITTYVIHALDFR